MRNNRLIHEKSPYLLQHAHNPVDWYPWGKEAFQKARKENKPVFLSIGYSTCHWCHVMERESFETQEAARVLNGSFVAVKVDREERPDVDAVYMAVCQAMTGSGGWPLTILMTPEQKPFWTGTYLPLHSRWGQPGLIELLEQVSRLWQEDRKALLEAGEELSHLASHRGEFPPLEPDQAMIRAGIAGLEQSFDSQNGGFGSAPKFPSPQNLLLLLTDLPETGGSSPSRMAEKTLEQMARGGIFDQIGGGFSRYSTDEAWRVPHFEKMLYDNALLIYTYLTAYEKTKDAFYRDTSVRTLEYVLKELKLPQGGFCCGQDADSDGEEGKYYLFSREEILKVLGREDGDRFCKLYGIGDRDDLGGKSVPNLLSQEQFRTAWKETKEALSRLYAYRLSREKLHRDDKVLTSWNALMICALSKACTVLEEPRYLEEARQTRKFLKEHLTTPEGELFLRWREGQAAYPGQLDDYAFLCWALLELYAAVGEADCLEEAASLAEKMQSLFQDSENGGLFLSPSNGERLIVRPKELYDGALPSGNSVAALVFVRLAGFTGEPKWMELAHRQLSYLAGNLRKYPEGHCFALLAMSQALSPSRELVCACAGEPPREVLRLGGKSRLYLLIKTRENAEQLGVAAPFTKAYPIPSRGETYYLCENGACGAPVHSLKELKKRL